MQFPLLGLARDFHPLDNAHAERTDNQLVTICDQFAVFCLFRYVCHIAIFIFDITNCDLKRIVVILRTKVVL